MIPPPRVLLACLVLLAVAGCGGSAVATSPTSPPKKHKQVATPTATTVVNEIATAAPATPTPTVLPPTLPPTVSPATATPLPPTATPLPTQAPVQRPPTVQVQAQPPRLVAASLQPNTLAAGGSLAAAVTTSGRVARVEMYLGSGAPNAPAPETFTLVQSSPGSWTGAGSAPSVAGAYHFTVGLYNAAGARTLVDNDGWNIQVTGGASSTSSTPAAPSGPQPLPANIPLAPPFSYGNPVAAVFSAEGKTVNGSEVVSTTITGVSPDTVAQFYVDHLPRAGWTVDQSTVPAGGAASFSIAATTSGSPNVCIVEYSASTVHIFYGTLPVG